MESSIFKAENLQLSKSKSCVIHISTRDEIVLHVPGTSSQYLWDPMFLVDCLGSVYVWQGTGSYIAGHHGRKDSHRRG